MKYNVAVHPAVRNKLVTLYRLDRSGYAYVKKRLKLLAYRPDLGVPLEAEFRGKWRIHIGPYVLVYTVDEALKTLTLLTFEHYTTAYDRYRAYA